MAAGLDWDALVTYLRTAVPDLEGPPTVCEFTYGLANLKFLVSFGDHSVVVRRPPQGPLPPGAYDMRREFRVLSRLWERYDRAPQAFALCEDEDVFGAPFVVLEYRVGEVVRGTLSAGLAHVHDVGSRLSDAVVDALVDLHTVDVATVGLQDLGRPHGFAERQVAGWWSRWQAVAGEGVHDAMARVHADLASRIPEPIRVSLVHNDVKLDNCQFAAGAPDRVATVFDWDMATLGDPLVDLGTLLNYWPDPSDPSDSRRAANAGEGSLGLRARSDLVARYLASVDARPGDVAWWEAFALWKTVVVYAQLDSRRAGIPPEEAASARRRAAELVDHADRLLRGPSPY